MSSSLNLGTTCVLAQAEGLRDKLVAFLQDVPDGHATIDLSQVEEADIALVQLMLSAARTAAAKGVVLDIRSSSASDALFAQAGLAGWTADPRLSS